MGVSASADAEARAMYEGFAAGFADAVSDAFPHVPDADVSELADMGATAFFTRLIEEYGDGGAIGCRSRKDAYAAGQAYAPALLEQAMLDR